jgi:hypothetical protein
MARNVLSGEAEIRKLYNTAKETSATRLTQSSVRASLTNPLPLNA